MIEGAGFCSRYGAPGGYPLYITDSQEVLDNAYPCSIHLGDRLTKVKRDVLIGYIQSKFLRVKVVHCNCCRRLYLVPSHWVFTRASKEGHGTFKGTRRQRVWSTEDKQLVVMGGSYNLVRIGVDGAFVSVLAVPLGPFDELGST